MRTSRFTPEQIIGFLKQVEAGMAVAELCRQHGFSPASFYQWRAKYDGWHATGWCAEGKPSPGAWRSRSERLASVGASVHLNHGNARRDTMASFLVIE